MLSLELENHQMVATNTFVRWFDKEMFDEGDAQCTTRPAWRGNVFGREASPSIDYLMQLRSGARHQRARIR